MKSLKLALISLVLAAPIAACGGKHPAVGVAEKFAEQACAAKTPEEGQKAAEDFGKNMQEAAKSGAAGSESDAKAITEATKKGTDCIGKLTAAPK